jgi:beta-galactosidase
LQKGDVYAHFDCAQKGIGNGSCGNVATLDKYLIPQGGEYSCSLLFTPVMGIESGVEDVVDNLIRFNVVDGKLVCEGSLDASATIALYNVGGVKVAETAVVQPADAVEIPLQGLPHGSYIVVVKKASGTFVHKVLL